MMKQAGKVLGCLLSGLIVCGSIKANTPESGSSANPYQGIVDRNIFGLKPPPPPAPPPEQPKPPVNITLTGITTLLGKKRAFLTVVGSPKAGAPPTTQSYMLREGERENDIEVVSIDEKEGVVKLKQSESPISVNFKDNGVKGGPAPAAVAGGGQPANPSPQPNPFTPASFPGQKTIPGRPLRIPGTPGANPSAGNSSAGFGNQASGFGEPTYYNGAAPQQNLQQQLQNPPPMNQEASALLIEAERLRLQDQGNPLANAMPTTRLTPAGAPGTLPNEATGNAGTGQQRTGGNSLPPVPGRPIFPQ